MDKNKRLLRCKNLHPVSSRTNSSRVNLWTWLRFLKVKHLRLKLILKSMFKHSRLVFQTNKLPKLRKLKLQLLLNRPLKRQPLPMVPPLKLRMHQLNNSSLLNNWLKYKLKHKLKPMLKLKLKQLLLRKHLLPLQKKQPRRSLQLKRKQKLPQSRNQLQKPQPLKLPLKLKSNLDWQQNNRLKFKHRLKLKLKLR